MDKQQLRQQLLQQRRQLEFPQWQSLSGQLCGQLQQWPLFQRARTVAIYCSTQREPDLSPLFCLPKLWALPRCVQKNLVWHPWRSGEELTVGTHGIPVPADISQTLSPQQIDLLLIPSVGGDRQGYRLGYGAGYYDRLLAHPVWQRVPRLGVLFELGMRETIKADPWDIPLQGWVTEKQLSWWGGNDD